MSLRFTKGDFPKLTDTLKVDGVVVNLTGATVQLAFQSGATNFTEAATVVSPAAGTVEYTFTTGKTAVTGLYRAQWVVTNGSVVAHFPAVPFEFEIMESVPETVTNLTPLNECYDLVRAILGDHHAEHPRWKDDAIDRNLRTMLRLGRVPGYALTPNQRGITPVITEARPLGLLTYHTAMSLLLPNVAAVSLRTRAASQSTGEQTKFLFALENALFDLTNGDGGVFVTVQSFYGWVNALTGMNLWQSLTDLKTNAPVATATIGRDGLQINV